MCGAHAKLGALDEPRTRRGSSTDIAEIGRFATYLETHGQRRDWSRSCRACSLSGAKAAIHLLLTAADFRGGTVDPPRPAFIFAISKQPRARSLIGAHWLEWADHRALWLGRSADWLGRRSARDGLWPTKRLRHYVDANRHKQDRRGTNSRQHAPTAYLVPWSLRHAARTDEARLKAPELPGVQHWSPFCFGKSHVGGTSLFRLG
jgi:hypothetical protein